MLSWTLGYLATFLRRERTREEGRRKNSFHSRAADPVRTSGSFVKCVHAREYNAHAASEEFPSIKGSSVNADTGRRDINEMPFNSFMRIQFELVEHSAGRIRSSKSSLRYPIYETSFLQIFSNIL